MNSFKQTKMKSLTLRDSDETRTSHRNKDRSQMPAKSKAQQRFMGLVKSYQDGDVPASKVSKSVKDASKSMEKGDVEDYASTKHKGKPEKVSKELKERPQQDQESIIRY